MKKALLFFTVATTILGVAWFSRMESHKPISNEYAAHFFDDDRYPAIRPIEQPTGLDPKRLELGRKLFFDRRLSSDQTISCASCHRFELGGTDGLAKSFGVGGKVGEINTPTVLNSSLNFVQFWDGRASSLEEQVEGPVHNPLEMASNWKQVISRLKKDSLLVSQFNHAYPDGLTVDNLTHAIATFERSLVTPDSDFDKYLRGDKSALSQQQIRGYQLFHSHGCISCHQGTLLGGNMFQKFGVLADYFAEREITTSDLGRYNVTGLEHDKHVFKVPSLRNIALTAPYFHDGSAPTLEAAVTIMARYQLGKDLKTDELQAIVAFLHSLTGKQPNAGAEP